MQDVENFVNTLKELRFAIGNCSIDEIRITDAEGYLKDVEFRKLLQVQEEYAVAASLCQFLYSIFASHRRKKEKEAQVQKTRAMLL